MVHVCSIHLQGAAAARTSGRTGRVRATGSAWGGMFAPGGEPRLRRNGRAPRAPAMARHLGSGRGCDAMGFARPGGGASARLRTSPAAATPPGTAAGRPPPGTRGDTACRVSRVSASALCTSLRGGHAATEAGSGGTPVAHRSRRTARMRWNTTDLAATAIDSDTETGRRQRVIRIWLL